MVAIFPLLSEEGVAAQTGWWPICMIGKHISFRHGFTTPSAPLRRLRVILLMSRPSSERRGKSSSISYLREGFLG